jgi:hypothetical protein
LHWLSSNHVLPATVLPHANPNEPEPNPNFHFADVCPNAKATQDVGTRYRDPVLSAMVRNTFPELLQIRKGEHTSCQRYKYYLQTNDPKTRMGMKIINFPLGAILWPAELGILVCTYYVTYVIETDPLRIDHDHYSFT